MRDPHTRPGCMSLPRRVAEAPTGPVTARDRHHVCRVAGRAVATSKPLLMSEPSPWSGSFLADTERSFPGGNPLPLRGRVRLAPHRTSDQLRPVDQCFPAASRWPLHPPYGPARAPGKGSGRCAHRHAPPPSPSGEGMDHRLPESATTMPYRLRGPGTRSSDWRAPTVAVLESATEVTRRGKHVAC